MIENLLGKLGRYKLPYLLLAPALFILGAFLVSPIFNGFLLSMKETPLGGGYKFVGFQNYLRLLREPRFLTNLGFSFYYLVGNLLISVPLGYTAALLVSTNSKAARFFRTFFLTPWILTPVVTALLFRAMVNPTTGPIKILVENFTGQSYFFLMNPQLARLTVVIHSAWRSFPVIMLFIAAGIAGIPRELYEAAKVDGANAWHLFRYVLFPLTKTQLFIVILLITAWTLQDAETIYALTRGGPGYSTEAVAVRLMKESFRYFNLGLGASIAVVLLIVSLLLMFFYLKLLRGER